MIPVYGIMFIFSLHYFLTLFINSSNLERFWSEGAIGNLYTYGSVITLVILVLAPKILKRTKVKHLLYGFLFLETVALYMLAFMNERYFVGVGMILLHAASPLIFFAIDIFMEELNKDSKRTGSVRSMLLTAANITVMLSPLIATWFISKSPFEKIFNIESSFENVYILSFILLIPVYWLVIKSSKKLIEPDIEKISTIHALKVFSFKNSMRRIFEANLVLKIFYAIMIIYMPIYLHTYVGFSLSEIGIMFTIMLVPFVIFEIPFGTIADKWLGEKEIMIFGFILSGLSVFVMFLYPEKNFFVFSTLLFLSRVGASAIEITTESYFFKKVQGKEIDIISFFRITNPLSFIIAPLIAIPIIRFSSEPYVLLALSIITVAGVIPALLLKDTK